MGNTGWRSEQGLLEDRADAEVRERGDRRHPFLASARFVGMPQVDTPRGRVDGGAGFWAVGAGAARCAYP